MFSDKFSIDGKPGVQRLEQVGAFLVIANKQRYEQGIPRKFTLVNEGKGYVDSVHGSYRSAVVYAQKHLASSSSRATRS